MKQLVVGSIVLILVTLGWGERGGGEEVTAPRGELRIVDKSPLNWVWISLNVFEHLIELDKDGKLVPRLATSWQWGNERTLEVTLRQGVVGFGTARRRAAFCNGLSAITAWMLHA